MAKEFKYRGKTVEELKQLSIEEFAKIVPSRARRALARGLSTGEKKLLKELQISPRPPKTKARNMVVIPQMIGKTIRIHNGKEFIAVNIAPEMLGMRLGELSLTRKRIRHSDPGMGATRSSKFISLK